MKDNQFWDKHYAQFREQAPSPFCRYCTEKVLDARDTVVEIGCGNGRDGLELARAVDTYIGLDTCPTAVRTFSEALAREQSQQVSASVRLENGATFDLGGVSAPERLAIYSRFSLHSISREDEARLFETLSALAPRPWICMIEARTIYDELYGVGDSVGPHEFITDHYRRFIDPRQFLSKVASTFDVRYFELSKGFASYKSEDPMVMRIVFSAQKA